MREVIWKVVILIMFSKCLSHYIWNHRQLNIQSSLEDYHDSMDNLNSNFVSMDSQNTTTSESKNTQSIISKSTDSYNVITPKLTSTIAKSCLEKDSCKNINPSDYNEKNQNCFCDDFCFIVDDCCQDIDEMPHLTNENIFNSTQLSIINKMEYQCTTFTSQSVYLKTSCSSEWGSDDIRYLCETPIQEKDDIFLNLPVTNIINKITYKNTFCAVCNNEDDSKLLSWIIELMCFGTIENVTLNFTDNGISFLKYNIQTGLWDINTTEYFNSTVSSSIECKHYITPGSNLQNKVRYCKPNINSCPEDWNDQNISLLCQNYTAYRYGYDQKTKQTVIYKNIHCGICHNNDLKNLNCHQNIRGHPKANFSDLSLSILTDINFSSGSERVGRLTCSKGEVYDAASRRCRRVTCGKFARLINGKCELL